MLLTELISAARAGVGELAVHNIAFLYWMAGEIRRSIRDGCFADEYYRWTGKTLS